MIVTVSVPTPWYIVRYEWQGAQDMTTDKDWYQSAEVCPTRDGAQERMEFYRGLQKPRPGGLTYRNIRGPFEWSEPTGVLRGSAPDDASIGSSDVVVEVHDGITKRILLDGHEIPNVVKASLEPATFTLLNLTIKISHAVVKHV